jgi:hypothetical protein
VLDLLKFLRRCNEFLGALPSPLRLLFWLTLWVLTLACFLGNGLTIKLGFILLGLAVVLGLEQADHNKDLPMLLLLLVVFAAVVFTVTSAYDWFILPDGE